MHWWVGLGLVYALVGWCRVGVCASGIVYWQACVLEYKLYLKVFEIMILLGVDIITVLY
jgi:hypothetical protein